MAKAGRKQIPIDELLLEKLTKLHLQNETIAHIVGCSTDTLDRRFAEKMKEWRSKSKGKIAEVLFDEGINKREPWALKALAQKHLDYHDKIKTENRTTSVSESMSDEEIQKQIEELKKRLGE